MYKEYVIFVILAAVRTKNCLIVTNELILEVFYMYILNMKLHESEYIFINPEDKVKVILILNIKM